MQALRAVFLDIGDTVMRPNPSWEHVYAIAFAEYGMEVSIEDLDRALRRAYRHGGYGFDEAGFDPTEESSFRRTVETDQAAIAELGIGPMPEAFYRRLAELFMITSHWHVFPDAYPALEGLKARGLMVGAVSNWVWNLPELLHSLDLVRHEVIQTAVTTVTEQLRRPENRELLAGLAPGNPYRVSRPKGPPATWPQDLLPAARA